MVPQTRQRGAAPGPLPLGSAGSGDRVERDRSAAAVASSSGAGAPSSMYGVEGGLQPDVRPGLLGQEPLLLEDVAVRLEGVAVRPDDRDAGAARRRLEDLAQPASARLRRRSGGARRHSSQARYSRRSLSSRRAWPSSATMPGQALELAGVEAPVGDGDPQPDRPRRRRAGSRLDLVDREAQVVEPPDPGPDRRAGRRARAPARGGAPPRPPRSGSGRSRRPRPRPRRRRRGPASRPRSASPNADVLDEDVEVVGALAVGQRGWISLVSASTR